MSGLGEGVGGAVAAGLALGASLGVGTVVGTGVSSWVGLGTAVATDGDATLEGVVVRSVGAEVSVGAAPLGVAGPPAQAARRRTRVAGSSAERPDVALISRYR